jgi:hypothetical protein
VRLAKRMAWTGTVERGGPVRCGGVGTLFPKVVLYHLVYKNAKKGGGLVVGIRLEFGVDMNDKCGGECGE